MNRRHLTANSKSPQAARPLLRATEQGQKCWRVIWHFGLTLTLVTLAAGSVSAAEPTDSTGERLTRAEKMTRRIDELLEAKMTQQGWKAAVECDDASFLRRSYLDLTGGPPSGREILRFLDDTDPEKRGKLIDELLESPGNASHFADIWSGWLLPDDAANPFAQPNIGLPTWLEERFASNLRYDRLVADLLVATGTPDSGPAGFFVALGSEPKRIAAKTARVFMGVQLDCAECHDHPFDDWTQRDFWGYAAYFAQLSGGDEAQMVQQPVISDGGTGEVTLPDSDEVVPPKPLVETGFSGIDSGTRRQQLTLWLTARENPFLARATVNRVWALLFGQGLIEPIDDMRSIEMASHPELLAELSDYFASTGYDLRDLTSVLAKTRAYRRSTVHVDGVPPPETYAVMATKPLTQLQMAASIAHAARQVTGDQSNALKEALRRQLGQLRGDASEAKLGIVSALVTLHGTAVDGVSREQSSRLLKALEAPFMDDEKRVRWLFLSTLSRLPTDAERQAIVEVASQASQTEDDANNRVAWQSDLLWALLNSSEFAMTP